MSGAAFGKWLDSDLGALVSALSILACILCATAMAAYSQSKGGGSRQFFALWGTIVLKECKEFVWCLALGTAEVIVFAFAFVLAIGLAMLLSITKAPLAVQCLQASAASQPWGQYTGSPATQAGIDATAELADPRHAIRVHLLDFFACPGTATYWSRRS